MSLLQSAFLFAGAFANFVIRVLYLPFAILAWAGQVLGTNWKLVVGLIGVGFVSWFATAYGITVITETEYAFHCRINPLYDADVYPILNGIIRTFFNRLICWYDAAVWMPYGTGRYVIFPIMRDGGFAASMTALKDFFDAVGTALFTDFFFTTAWTHTLPDYTQVNVQWIQFIEAWQHLWCYGCGDLCPYYTKLPIIPAIFLTSDQFKDPKFLCAVEKHLDGWIAGFQEVVYALRQVVYPSPGVPLFVPSFNQTVDLWIESGSCWWESWEDALQVAWDTFIPYPFVWKDMFCWIDRLQASFLVFDHILWFTVSNPNGIYEHFAGIDSTFYDYVIKFNFKYYVNLIGTPANFDTINVTLPGGAFMVITNYNLNSTEQDTVDGFWNPMYQQKSAAECVCIAITRIVCDPQNNGTTCAQQFNGTLLESFDPCCFGGELFSAWANFVTYLFEFTLHLDTVSDFVMAIDQQPFTTYIALNIDLFFGCLFQIFRAVETYGTCIQSVLTNLVVLIVNTTEVAWRTLWALLTLPYFDTFIPGVANFITNQTRLSNELGYLNVIANTSSPMGMINCLCFILNTGFNVPFAGCHNITCVPTGFIPVNMAKRFVAIPPEGAIATRFQHVVFSDSFYNLTSRTRMYEHRLTPILTYSGQMPNSVHFPSIRQVRMASDAFHEAFELIDKKVDRVIETSRCSSRHVPSPMCPFAESVRRSRRTDSAPDLRTSDRSLILMNTTGLIINCTDPNNYSPNPMPCFNLCCLPSKLIVTSVGLIGTFFRGLNAGFASRFNVNGSSYWDGTACQQGMPCFQSDITDFVTSAFSIVDCLCEFILLVLPPQGFGDPCCAFTILGEIVSCTLQIAINVGNSIAGDPNFTYIRDPSMMAADVDIVLDLVLAEFDCICDFLRTILNLVLTGLGFPYGFNPCCFPRVFLKAELKVISLLVRMTLALTSLNTPTGACFFYVNNYGNARPDCPVSVADLEIVRRFKEILQILFVPPVNPATFKQCSAIIEIVNNDPNLDGLPTCICRITNTLLAMVYQTINYVGDLDAPPNCVINLCCIYYRIGQIIVELGDFGAQLIATVWQNWSFTSEIIQGHNETFFIPFETMNFLFCDEYGYGPYQSDGITPNPMYYPLGPNYQPIQANQPWSTVSQNSNGSAVNGIVNPNFLAGAKCGKIEPALTALQNLVDDCICSPEGNGIGNIADNLLRWLFSYTTGLSTIMPVPFVWSNCFCSGGMDGTGILVPLGDFIVIFIRGTINLLRNLANPTYFTMQGGTITDPNFILGGLTDNFLDIRYTWINRWLAPSADAFCRLFTNSGCLLSIVLGDNCVDQRYTALSSISTYAAQFVIRVGGGFEGMIKSFTQEPPGLCVGHGTQGNAQRPTDQGTTGLTGSVVPTCSPRGTTNDGIVRGIDTFQVGRVLNAFGMFIFDALGGIASLSCSSICPGFYPDPTKILNAQCFLYGGTQTCFYPGTGNVGSQDSICRCWNYSPYVLGLASSSQYICGFNVCADAFNSGFSNFSCPLFSPTRCSEMQAWNNTANTGKAVNATFQTLVDRGYCNGGCAAGPVVTNGATYVVSPDEHLFVPAQTISWLQATDCPFRAVLSNSTASGVACELDPFCANSADSQKYLPYLPATLPVLQNWTGPNVTQPQCFDQSYTSSWLFTNDVLVSNIKAPYLGTCWFYYSRCIPWFQAGSPLNGILDGNWPNFVLCKPFQAGAYGSGFAAPTTVYGSIPILDACNLCLQIVNNGTYYTGFAPKNFQRPCDRTLCLGDIGLCKNDQMQTCTIGGPILDGVIPSILKYILCLQLKLYNNFPANTIEPLLYLDSFLWQLSGGIVRFIVYLILWVINIIASIGNFLDALTVFIGGLLQLVGLFFNIFGQSVALNYRATTDSMFQIKPYFDYNDAHECATTNEPVQCICGVLRYNDYCRYDSGILTPSDVTLSGVLGFLTSYFSDDSHCDMLMKHFSEMNIQNWTQDASYAQRFSFSECLGKRAKGDQFYVQSKGFVPVNFFYHSKGWYNLFTKFVKSRMQRNQPKTRFEADDKFRKHFKMTRDSYARLLNSRGEQVKEFYRKVAKMDEKLPSFWLSVHLDSYFFRYTSGYYSYLWKNANMGNLIENLQTEDSLQDAFDELKKMYRLVQPAFAHGEKIFDNQIKPQIKAVVPEWAKRFWRARWIPQIPWERINVRFNPPRFDPKVRIFPHNYKETPRIRRNWDLGRRFLYGLAHTIAPHYTSKEIHDRFIIGQNCTIYDGTVNLGTKVFDYCINDFVANLNGTKRTVLEEYLERTSHLRSGSFFNRFRGRIRWEPKFGRMHPKIIHDEPKASVPRIDKKMYKRAMAVNPGGFVGYFIDIIDRIFGIDLIQDLNSFFNSFSSFMQNPNIDPAAGNVGAEYWLLYFPTHCDFPDNLNCFFGIGLGEAVWKVGLIFLIALAVIAIFIPGLLSVTTTVVSVVLYVLIVLAVGVRYSPACILPFPSMEIQGTSISIPVLPFPVPILPMLPMCLWDELLDILSSIFATCYTWIPQTLINNISPCRPCPEKLSMTECSVFGLNLPVSVTTFWLWKIFGYVACDVMEGITSVYVFSWIPGITSSVQTTCHYLKLAATSDSIYDRMLLCASMGFGFFAWVGLGSFVLGTFIVAVVLAIINIIHAVILLIQTMPFFQAITGEDENEFGTPEGEAEFQERPRARGSAVDKMAMQLRKWISPHQKTE
jgi:hypothetical protein